MTAVSLVVRLILSMGAVIGVMWVAGRILRNRSALGTSRAGGSQTIEVLARRGLSKGASVAVVRAAGRTVLLGVTDANVTLLGDADPEAIEEMLVGATGSPQSSRPALPWRRTVETLRERTVRRSA